MDARTAIVRFCNYQERSHQEVRDRLYELGLHGSEVEQLISELIELGLLNEQRFAASYVRGKFSLKRWGRVKITQGLKRHRISDYLIKNALKEIDPSEYFAAALRLAKAKWEILQKDGKGLRQQFRLRNYLLQKGFESSLIREVVEIIMAGEQS